jgi:branched-chain amino acid transport system permease protein
LTHTLQLIFAGLAQGMIYALVAFGYNITFATSKTLNFALGNYLMAGGVVGFLLYMTHGVPYFGTVLGVIAVGCAGGAVLHWVAIEPSLKRRSPHNWILATLAVSLILRNAAEVFWSTDDFRPRSPLGDDHWRWAGVGVFPQEVLILVASLAVVAAVDALRRWTLWGRAAQAVSEDPGTASLMGINARRVVTASFMLSTAIACLGGLLVGPVTLVSATMGTVIGVKAYAASIIGGLESGWGVVVGGALLGISESLTARLGFTGYKDVPGFVLLIVVLLAKPSGLFGRASIQKV